MKRLAILFLLLSIPVMLFASGYHPEYTSDGRTICVPDLTTPTAEWPGDGLGVSPVRYIESAYSVKDLKLNLEWEISTDKAKRNWLDSIKHCEQLTHGGLNDWRIPTMAELNTAPPLDWTGSYYSSDETPTNSEKARTLTGGRTKSISKTDLAYSRCVR